MANVDQAFDARGPEWRWDRYHRRWVVISPRRAKRPGSYPPVNMVADLGDGGVDPCPFCPGHEDRTPPEILRHGEGGSGWNLRVIPNLYGLVQPSENPAPWGNAADPTSGGSRPPASMPAHGAAEVIIETPDHHMQMADLSAAEVGLFFRTCAERIRQHRAQGYPYACVFKNYGREAGASLAHSHSQLIALPFVPPEVLRWHGLGGADGADGDEGGDACPFCVDGEDGFPPDYAVTTAGDWRSFVPWASAAPYEMWITPRAHHADHGVDDGVDDEVSLVDFASFPDAALNVLGDLLRRHLRALRATVGDVPYNLLFHAFSTPAVHWHLEIVPRITRIAGFEWATGSYVNPVDPADAARRLREEVGGGG